MRNALSTVGVRHAVFGGVVAVVGEREQSGAAWVVVVYGSLSRLGAD